MPASTAPATARAAAPSRASELRLELHTVGARIVDEAGQVVKVDGADRDDLVGDVATEGRHLVLAAVPVVAHAQAARQQRLAGELGGLVEEEVDLAAVRPVGVDEVLAAAV